MARKPSSRLRTTVAPFVTIYTRAVVQREAYNFHKIREVFKRVFGKDAYTEKENPNPETPANNLLLKPLYKSWVDARALGIVEHEWAETQSAILGNRLTVDELEEMSQHWESRLVSLINEKVVMVGVWRLSRESTSAMAYSIFDEMEKPDYPLPTIHKEVAGSTKEEYTVKGQKFVWMLSVAPAIFEGLYNFPVGGSATFKPIYNLSVYQIVAGDGEWKEFWQPEADARRRESNNSRLITMMGLNGGFTDMTGHPVVSSHIAFVLKNWGKVMFPNNV